MGPPLQLSRILMMLAVTGCASEPLLPAPPSDSLAGIDPQAISVASDAHALSVERPVSDIEAAAGAGAEQGAAGSVGGGFAMCLTGSGPACAIGMAAGLVLALPAAAVGAGVGALRVRGPDEVARAHTDLLAALQAQQPAAALQQRVRALAQSQWTPADGTGPETPRASGLEIAFTEFDLRVFGEIDPSLTLVMAVTGDVVARDSDLPARSRGFAPAKAGRLLYRRKWRYESETRAFFELGADGAAPLREEFDMAYDGLARRIVGDLSVPEPSERTDKGDAGTAWSEAASDLSNSALVSDGGQCGGEDLRAFILRIDDESVAAALFEPATLPLVPGDHALTIACATLRSRPDAEGKRCGRIAFRAEAGHAYDVRWSLAADRLALHDVRRAAVAASGTTRPRLERSMLAAMFTPSRC